MERRIFPEGKDRIGRGGGVAYEFSPVGRTDPHWMKLCGGMTVV
jgi:hypothetical protein